MITQITDFLPKPESDAQVVEITDVKEAKAYWKFALYASYVQAVILADNCEYCIPK